MRSYPGGGAPKPPQLHYDLKREIGGIGIVSGYGLTEAPIVVMASEHDPDEKLATTEGRATPGVDLIVVRLDGERAGPGEEGEIRLRAPRSSVATSTRPSTAMPSTTRATSAPATSGWSTRRVT